MAKGPKETSDAEVSDAAPLGWARRIWNQVAPRVGGVALARLIRARIVETFYVPSESMLPSLLIGDHVFVSKFSYGSRIPFTDIRLPALRDPERGEVVVFDLGKRDSEICPLDRCPDYPLESFVKRVVGLPGDTVEVRRGTVLLNDQPLGVEWGTESFEDNHGRRLRMGREARPGATAPPPRSAGCAATDSVSANKPSSTVPTPATFSVWVFIVPRPIISSYGRARRGCFQAPIRG